MADIVAIDPTKVKQEARQSGSSQGTASKVFDDVLTTVAPFAMGTAAAYGSPNSQVMTSATLTGLAGANASLNSSANPQTQALFAGGGYGYAGVPFAGGYGSIGASAGYGVPGVGVPSQDYMEKQALFQQMNDANWEMLVAQVTVNDISRDFTSWSNILAEKHRTESEITRNFRG
jgi:hypothetical protein